MVTGGHMKRIKAFQAKNTQAAGNTGNTGNTTKNWNTTSMTDNEVGARNPKLKNVLQSQAKRPDWGGKPKPGKTGKKTYKGDVSYSDVKKNKKGADYSARLKEAHGVGYETTLGLKPPSALDKPTAKAISGSKGKPDVEPKEGHVWRKIKNKWREVPTAGKKTPPDENDKTPSSSGHPFTGRTGR